jgi:hypothetical protein
VIPSALMRQTLTIKPKTGEGAAKPLYGDPVTYAARIEAKRRQVRDGAGNITVSELVAWLRPEAVVAAGDQAIVFGRTLTVLAVTEMRGLTQLEGYEVLLGEPGGSGRAR